MSKRFNNNAWHTVVLCDDGEELTVCNAAKKYNVKPCVISNALRNTNHKVKGHNIKLLHRYKYEYEYTVYDLESNEEVCRGTADYISEQFNVCRDALYNNFRYGFKSFCGAYRLERKERKIVYENL